MNWADSQWHLTLTDINYTTLAVAKTCLNENDVVHFAYQQVLRSIYSRQQPKVIYGQWYVP